MATDIDQSALAWAKAGGPYTADDVAGLPPHFRMNFLEVRNNEYWVKDDIRKKVSFRHHNLLDDSTAGKFDLIVCRNVVIYFQPDAKQELYHRFYNSLKPGGILFVGGTEIVPKATEMGFETLHVSFYRRKDSRRHSSNGKHALPAMRPR
jgi:chemotaxis protein methyltransferase CheR